MKKIAGIVAAIHVILAVAIFGGLVISQFDGWLYGVFLMYIIDFPASSVFYRALEMLNLASYTREPPWAFCTQY